MSDLTGKVAIVTGASSGIGAAIILRLLKLGMKVVGLARRKEKVEELGNGYEGKLFAIKADVNNQDDMLDSFDWIRENVGPIFLLVNSAGIYVCKTTIEATIEDWKDVLNTNLVSLTLFTQQAIKTMTEDKTDGIIININSVSGHHIRPYIGIPTYNASKYGITGFTESIRMDLAEAGSKIRITSLSPGLVETPMTTQEDMEKYPYLGADDIANAVEFILTQPSNVNITELTIRPVGETAF